jgi:hypothetical protein
MIGINAIDETSIEADLLDFVRETGRDLEREVRIVARALAVSLCYATVPIGFGSTARGAGRGAILRDLARVFIPPSVFYVRLKRDDEAGAADFWRAYLADDFGTMSAYASADGTDISRTPSRAKHKAARNGRGRVGKSNRQALVVDPSALGVYGRRVVARAGLAKAGWAAAAAETGGTSGIPAWASVTAHPHASGGATHSRTGSAFTTEIRNDTPWITEILPPGLVWRAIDLAERNLRTRFQIVLDARSSDPF